ncbi:hypothetical protein [Photorhabdus heterorhabditis]|uniref:Uncharacterized protein n=1 Tax=Photorhabdus heterorhabditis TaxID=880156 RepID=A0A5B0WJF2_9GAMM|nr:hypothetical protein [Photorhabdus heterorhabditis]KAA1186059.1 hypothetical protein F0L16_14535 [Photorhabdus heterorhabditis]KOY61064.1 hypothetical protein AM629_15950 [Photorhabdus heterorhabditis]MBS9442873.1 hypothetical protein [Photorhabdus heterorhabditis]
MAFTITNDLQENHGELAEKLDELEGELQEKIINWLKEHRQDGGAISNLTSTNYSQMLNKQHITTVSPSAQGTLYSHYLTLFYYRFIPANTRNSFTLPSL